MVMARDTMSQMMVRPVPPAAKLARLPRQCNWAWGLTYVDVAVHSIFPDLNVSVEGGIHDDDRRIGAKTAMCPSAADSTAMENGNLASIYKAQKFETKYQVSLEGEGAPHYVNVGMQEPMP